MKLLTILGLTVCGVAFSVVTSLPGVVDVYRVVLGAILAGVVGVSAAFTVRGYSLNGRRLEIHRLWWSTELSLSGLRSVTHDPDTMRRSIRIFGNGGLFGVTGWFWNSTLRRYRAFVTDPTLAVVLRFESRVVVISPDPPTQFVAEVRQSCRLPGVMADG